MRQLIAFTQKEFCETVRSGKLLILTILFVLFGIMNPAIAKMTPWMMEMMSESLAETGMTVTEIVVTAQTSWTQFYKNIPILLIVFLLMFSGTLVNEYQKGTLVNMVTKGLKRWKIIAAKTIVMTGIWTLGYWICFGITYGYNAYFWDNRVSKHLVFAAACFYLAGIWLITVVMMLSTIAGTSAFVMLGTGCVFGASYLLGLFHDIKKYVPTYLMSSESLLVGASGASDYFWAAVLACVIIIADLVAAIVYFNKIDF